MERTYFPHSLICFLLCCATVAAASACVKLPRRASAPAEYPANPAVAAGAHRLDLNRATAQELESLPGVGPALAARIVEHRQRYGPFRRAEHLMVVRGISERRFRELQSLVRVE